MALRLGLVCVQICMFVVGGTKEPSEYIFKFLCEVLTPDPNGGRQHIRQVVTAVQQLCSNFKGLSNSDLTDNA